MVKFFLTQSWLACILDSYVNESPKMLCNVMHHCRFLLGFLCAFRLSDEAQPFAMVCRYTLPATRAGSEQSVSYDVPKNYVGYNKTGQSSAAHTKHKKDTNPHDYGKHAPCAISSSDLCMCHPKKQVFTQGCSSFKEHLPLTTRRPPW